MQKNTNFRVFLAFCHDYYRNSPDFDISRFERFSKNHWIEYALLTLDFDEKCQKNTIFRVFWHIFIKNLVLARHVLFKWFPSRPWLVMLWICQGEAREWWFFIKKLQFFAIFFMKNLHPLASDWHVHDDPWSKMSQNMAKNDIFCHGVTFWNMVFSRASRRYHLLCRIGSCVVRVRVRVVLEMTQMASRQKNCTHIIMTPPYPHGTMVPTLDTRNHWETYA